MFGYEATVINADKQLTVNGTVKDVVANVSNKAQNITKCLSEVLAIAKELKMHHYLK